MRQSEFFKEYGKMLVYLLDDKIEQVEHNAGSDKEDECYLKSLNNLRKVIEEKIAELRIIELEDKVVADNWEQIYDSFSEAEREEYDKLVYEDE